MSHKTSGLQSFTLRKIRLPAESAVLLHPLMHDIINSFIQKCQAKTHKSQPQRPTRNLFGLAHFWTERDTRTMAWSGMATGVQTHKL